MYSLETLCGFTVTGGFRTNMIDVMGRMNLVSLDLASFAPTQLRGAMGACRGFMARRTTVLARYGRPHPAVVQNFPASWALLRARGWRLPQPIMDSLFAVWPERKQKSDFADQVLS